MNSELWIINIVTSSGNSKVVALLFCDNLKFFTFIIVQSQWVCTPLKQAYDTCFNSWFEAYSEPTVSASSSAEARTEYSKRKAEEFQEKCGKIWESYRSCVQVYNFSSIETFWWVLSRIESSEGKRSWSIASTGEGGESAYWSFTSTVEVMETYFLDFCSKSICSYRCVRLILDKVRNWQSWQTTYIAETQCSCRRIMHEEDFSKCDLFLASTNIVAVLCM